MKVAIGIGSAYYNGDDWNELVDYTVAADTMGVDYVWSAEAWGMDAVVPLAYLAAKTQHIKLGTGIMQISSRVPPMIAMTAQSLRTVCFGFRRLRPTSRRRVARRILCQTPVKIA
jgi:alkanesulfonate monooxygenase SsuD/methylene tetrahydromethanopterin reductase-like flavin-dependent oxidoreductase (luciferase family)